MQSYALGRQWGILTANECREDMGYNARGPEGDVLLTAVNMADSSQVLKDKDLIPTTQEPAPSTDEPTSDPLNSQDPQPKKKDQ